MLVWGDKHICFVAGCYIKRDKENILGLVSGGHHPILHLNVDLWRNGPSISSRWESRNQGIDSPICAALPSGPASHTQSSFTMCPSEKPAEDPHRLQGTWIMHGANAASSASDCLLLPLCQHMQQEERSTEGERTRERLMGVAEVQGGIGEEALKGLRKGKGYRKKELVKAKKREKGQDIGGGREGEEQGRILKRVKRAEKWESSGCRRWKRKNKSIYSEM